jgi:hypothetical protein
MSIELAMPLGRVSSGTEALSSVSLTNITFLKSFSGRLRFASSHIGVKYHEKFATYTVPLNPGNL